jgi:hypothetical protein
MLESVKTARNASRGSVLSEKNQPSRIVVRGVMRGGARAIILNNTRMARRAMSPAHTAVQHDVACVFVVARTWRPPKNPPCRQSVRYPASAPSARSANRCSMLAPQYMTLRPPRRKRHARQCAVVQASSWRVRAKPKQPLTPLSPAAFAACREEAPWRQCRALARLQAHSRRPAGAVQENSSGA